MEKPKLKDEYGRLHMYKETMELLDLASMEMHSTSRREYEESHLEATMAAHRAVGYTVMAEELEPFNPSVLWERGFIADMSGKSVEYMLDLTSSLIIKMKVGKNHGYEPKDDYNIKIMDHAMKDFIKQTLDGKIYPPNVH